MMLHDAIYELNASIKSIDDMIAYDSDGNQVSYNLEEAQALADSKAYIDNRRGEYPDIGDQLDDLFKAGAFSTEMTATIQAVKDKYPKE